jgi:hypothetical protein
VAQAARFFGRDTSTMINGVNRLEADMENDRGLRQRLHAMRETVRQNKPIRRDGPRDSLRPTEGHLGTVVAPGRLAFGIGVLR